MSKLIRFNNKNNILNAFIVTRFFFLLSIFIALPALATPAQVAIVIDDIGYRQTDRQVLTLPGNVTYAVLPHTPFGKKLATIAYQRKLDVILHIPMESTRGKRLGPGGLTSDMNEQSIRRTLANSFKEIPFAIGINNHMGSHLTTLENSMTWTMRYLKDNELLFLDSVTSPKTLARITANRLGVPSRNRHVFLDNQLNHDYIAGQFQQLISKAKKNQTAIAIAHPHPETISALAKLIPTLKKHGIELVNLSTLYPTMNINNDILVQAE